jgi:hypothetical protein
MPQSKLQTEIHPGQILAGFLQYQVPSESSPGAGGGERRGEAMINLRDIPPFKNAPMGFEFRAHRMYGGFNPEMLDRNWELTGEFRFVNKDDEGYLGWSEEGFLVVVPGGVRR